MKYIPQRKCIVCNKIIDKDKLVRISKNKNDEIRLDINKNNEGRGAYICKNDDCPSLLIKKGGLNRSFKNKIPAEIQNGILEELVNSEQ